MSGFTPDALLRQQTRPTGLDEVPGLDRMRRLVTLLGDPQAGLPVVHVGGTSGKGSTATFIAAILHEAGIPVGLHTKPHLSSVTERFLVNGQPIAEAALVGLLEGATSASDAVRPTWHELTVALALQHFARERVTAVVEVGLGGEFDSTNVVEPLVVVLTNVGLDHTEILGETIAEIATTKAGIIKAGAIVVTGARGIAGAIITSRCVDLDVPLLRAGTEITWQVLDHTLSGARFHLDVPGRHFDGLRLCMMGRHQVENAALAVAAVQALEPHGYAVSDDAIRRALATTAVPGRLEMMPGSPPVLFDGAHSPPKMAALAATLRDVLPNRPLVAVLASKRGHDVDATMHELAPLLRAAVVTRYDASADFGGNTAHPPDALADTLRHVGGPNMIHIEPDAARAFVLAQQMASELPDAIVLVTGSLYLVGQLRDLVTPPLP